MNILFTRFPLESTYGGAEVQVLSLVEGLKKHGHSVRFIGSCPVLAEELLKKYVPVMKVDIGPPPVTKKHALSFLWRNTATKLKLQQLVASIEQKPDVIFMLSLSEKILLTRWAHKRGIKVIWIEHDRVSRWLRLNPWLSLLKRAGKHATIVTVSQLSKKLYLKMGFKEERLTVIPNGVSVERFKAGEEGENSAPPIDESQGKQASQNEREKGQKKVEEDLEVKELEVSDDKPEEVRAEKDRESEQEKERKEENVLKIGCIARLTHDKGVDVLIQAVKDLPVRLSIVGSGRDESSIEKMVEQSSNITLDTSPVDIGTFYHLIDVLILPSRDNDPFGLVVAEAMMLGIPVIVTDQCGVTDYLTNGEDAIIVPAGNIDALRIAINKMTDLSLRTEIGSSGQNTALKQFTIDKMVDRYSAILQ